MTIHIPRPLRPYAGDCASVAVEVATAGAAIEELTKLHPDLGPRLLNRGGALHAYFALILDDAQLPRDGYARVSLAEGAVLRILPIVGGG